MKKQHRHLTDILESQGSTTLQLISKQINILEEANKVLHKINHPLLNECYIANINNNIITLHTNKLHILNEIKLTASQIINILKTYPSFSQITTLRIKPQYKKPQMIKKKNNQTPQLLPEQSTKDLFNLEKNCNCPDLQKSIKRLITKHGRQPFS